MLSGVALFCLLVAPPIPGSGPDPADKPRDPIEDRPHRNIGDLPGDLGAKVLAVGAAGGPENTMLYTVTLVSLIAIVLFLGGALALIGVLAVKGKLGEARTYQAILAIVVVGLGVLLVVAGFSQGQIAIIAALLGSVLGYVFGKDSTAGSPPAPPGSGNSSP